MGFSLNSQPIATCMLEYVNDCTLSFKNNRNVAIAHVDYSKAFDIVSHLKLLFKLTNWGLTGNLLSRIKSFLSNRTHCTRVGNAVSRPLQLPRGVVQGSCIGALLFTVYINDVCKIYLTMIPNASCTYDVKLYSEIVADDDQTELHDNLDALNG